MEWGSIFLRGLQIGGISLFDSQPISWRWMFIDPNVIWNASVIWNAQATKEKTQAGTRRDCDSLDVALKKDGVLHARTQIDIVFMGYQNWCLDPGLDCQGDEKDSDEEKSSKGKANLAAERVSEALVNLLFTHAHTHSPHLV